MNPGGKGANQAVAVARLGGNACFIAKVGNDIFGKQAIQLFYDEGIDTRYLVSDEAFPSGVALITVDQNGENSIVVASGANANFFPSDLSSALEEILRFDIVLMQLEIPMETILFVAKTVSKENIKVILDPAPANELSNELLHYIDIITPNQTEAEVLSGIKITDVDSAKEAALVIYAKGVKNVIVTLGALGAVVCQEGNMYLVRAPVVKAIDTTAAGDVFNGALAVALSEDKPLIKAVEFACMVAALSVTRIGARSSIPSRNEVLASNTMTENLDLKRTGFRNQFTTKI
jgi:ribokinase